MKQKDLDKEGITKEFLSTISAKKLGNPVQLLLNDEPVNLVKCMAGFWVSVDGELIKDKKNNYLVVSEKEAIIGRARYLLNFKEQIEKEEGSIYEEHLRVKIKEEIQRLKELTKEKVEKYLSEVKFLLQLSGKIETDLIFTLKKLTFEKEGNLEQEIIEAKRVVEIDWFIESYEQIKKWLEEENFDDLYSYFFQNGNYQIASFDESNIDILVKFFHRDKLKKTIEEIGSNSHLENVAKFNVESKLKVKT